MTRTFLYAQVAPSANDAFKLHYPRYLKGAVLAALALTALFVWLFPGYEPVAYQLREPEIFIGVRIPEPPVVPVPPPIKTVLQTWKPIFPDPAPGLDPEPIGPPGFWDPYLPPPPPLDEGFIPSSAKPVLTYFVKADYPEIARRARLEGTVIVHALVGPTGRVLYVEFIQGAHPILNKAALAAAQRCRFSPGEQRNMPVKSWVAIPYNFRLH